MNDSGLAQALSLTPPNCILLIEDIDVVQPPRDAVRDGKPRLAHPSGMKVTLAGLLNALSVLVPRPRVRYHDAELCDSDGAGAMDGRQVHRRPQTPVDPDTSALIGSYSRPQTTSKSSTPL